MAKSPKPIFHPGISPLADFRGEEYLQSRINWQIAMNRAYKIPNKDAPIKTQAFTFYVRQMCEIAASAVNIPRITQLRSVDEFQDLYWADNAVPTFESLLRYVWNAGIPVLPIGDPHLFHGACWMIKDRPIIVLKQDTKFHAHWLFALAHTVGHVLLHLTPGGPDVVEEQEISPVIFDDEREDAANDFALKLLFRNQEDDLIEEVANKALGSLQFLKRALIETTTLNRVPVDLLAFYLMYRLSLQGESWWEAAKDLQYSDPNPLNLARHLFMRGVTLSSLKPNECSMLYDILMPTDS